jgi:hypothetical protein
MADNMAKQTNEQTPQPNPDLKSLEKLVGTWEVTGEAQGTSTYQWLEGGFFIVQHIDLVVQGKKFNATEFIGHENKLGQELGKEIKSSLFSFLDGMTWNYVYELEGDTLRIWAGEKGSPAQFNGKFSADGSSYSGEWVFPGGGYKATATKIK